MVFERSSPSCYSCEPFTALVSQSRGGIVVAGFAGESACLSTLIDAFHRKHKVTYLCDASASHALDDMSADEVHRAVSRISGLYGEVYETTDWIAATLPRKLGNGKTLVANSEERLHSVLATLEGCRSNLVDSADLETAQFVSVAILQLRLKLNQISAPELNALCDAMLPDDEPAERPRDSRSPQRHSRHPSAVLKLVK